jgi:hypothetical protein
VPPPVLQAFFVRIDFTQFSRTNAPPDFSGGRSIRVSPKAVKLPPKRPLFGNALLDAQLVHSILVKTPLRVIETGQEEIVWRPRE